MATQLPKISHVLELCLYAQSLPKSVAFYRDTLRLGAPFLSNERMAAFSLSNTTLLLFQRGATTSDSRLGNDGLIPGHGLPSSFSDVELKTHFCLAVDTRDDVLKWEDEFKSKGVNVTGKVDWPSGGRSLYFEDPDRHVGELASKGIWPHY